MTNLKQKNVDGIESNALNIKDNNSHDDLKLEIRLLRAEIYKNNQKICGQLDSINSSL